MEKLFGRSKFKTAIFISGSGTNLKNLIIFSNKKKSPISVNLIISNKKKAKGLMYGKKYKIEQKVINFNNQSMAEKKILKLLIKRKISFICLAGFMKILSRDFISKFSGKIINIHPSLLPKYKGMNTHKRALQNNERFAGCTVHYVSSKLDSGKIIMQRKVGITKNESLTSLKKKVLKLEHLIYPKAIKKILA